MTDPTPYNQVFEHTGWRKSSYSGVQSDCIEIADGLPALTPVRDSKNPHGPTLLFETSAWSTFVHGLKTGPIRPQNAR
ncbi:DUF397 domain-containing protein [Streptomyces hesseae]|uniref:DUF397 domain-containing protein n=1 Tax=Streptomyces hesseae TaxID=3075519 RepID=A0ABU2SWA7_9ACTN|nr:DUF397 domain-containing protein [Streptomyces sp. DSM 40473]MDT0453279.1 DUF397 domain-containing protein [Streptomyces sp. DSM 40473]